MKKCKLIQTSWIDSLFDSVKKNFTSEFNLLKSGANVQQHQVNQTYVHKPLNTHLWMIARCPKQTGVFA